MKDRLCYPGAMLQAIQKLAWWMTFTAMCLSLIAEVILFSLGDEQGSRRVIYALASCFITGAVAILLKTVYEAGAPFARLDAVRPAEAREERAAPHSDTTWIVLAMAVLLWGMQALLSVPGDVLEGVATHLNNAEQRQSIAEYVCDNAALINAEAVPEIRCELKSTYSGVVTAAQMFLSVSNNFLFFIAAIGIERTGERTHLVRWLSTPGWRKRINYFFIVVGVLIMFSGLPAALGGLYIPIADTAIGFVLSIGVLLIYGTELSRALSERGLKSFLLAWWVGLGCQACVELLNLFDLLSHRSVAPWLEDYGVSPGFFAPSTLSLLAQSLFGLTLVAQAVSWFSTMARNAARDLLDVQTWISKLQEEVSGSPLAEGLDEPLAMTKRHRPRLLGGSKVGGGDERP